MRQTSAAVVAALLSALPIPSAPAQWQPQSSGTDVELRGLSVVSTTAVWVSGAAGHVGRTTDGGRTWRVDTVPGASALDFRAVHALDARRAWVMSAGDADKGQARIYRTTDGGAHWTLVYSTEQKGVFFDAIAFWDARYGIAMSDPVDGRFFLLITSDGGRSWTRVAPDRLPPALTGEAAFAASGSCLTVQGATNVWIGTGGGSTARIFGSTDRGRTWRVSDSPIHAGSASSGIFSLAFRDSRHGIAVGGDYTQPRGNVANVALTDDGGRSWRLARGPLPDGYQSAVSFAGTTRVIAVGLAGTALSTDGGESWMMADSVAFNSVRFLSPSVGWAAGPKGRIARWR